MEDVSTATGVSTEMANDAAMEQAGVLPLEQLLCFDLYEATNALAELYRPLLEDLGLTYTQYLALVCLVPGQTVTHQEMQRALSLDLESLEPVVTRLEAAGLIDRRRSSLAMREVEFCLTDAGVWVRSRFEGVQCVVGEAMGLDNAEFAALQASVRGLAEAVRGAMSSVTARDGH